MSFEWKSTFEVGVDVIDQDHKRLVALISSLESAGKQGKAKQALGLILAELIGYTEFHFRNEETLMRMKQYPESEQHAKEHQWFVAKINSFISLFQTSAGVPVADIMTFMVDWLLNHINRSDRKLAAFLNEAGIK